MTKNLPKPAHLVYMDEIEVRGETFCVGDSVWIEGRRKGATSNNLLAQIVHNTRSGEVYVNVFCENRGKGGWHSFAPDRLIKRNKKKRKVTSG